MSDKHFLTFPHCLFAIPGDEKLKMDIMLSHSARQAGTSGRSNEITREQCKRNAKENGLKSYWGSELQVALIRGSIICGFKFGSIEVAEKNFSDGEKFANEHQNKYGNSPLVFVSSQLFWGCYTEQEPTFREFSTLCGINSIVGLKKRPVLIRRSMILARQLGYKSPAVHLAAMREDQKPLTTQQLRDTLDALEMRDLIARFPCGHSNIYFGTGISYDELKTAVADLKQRKNKIALRRELERNQAGTKQEPMKKKPAKSGEKEPMKKEEPIDLQDGTKEGTKGGTKTGTNEIKASLIKAPLTKASQIKDEIAGESSLTEISQEEGAAKKDKELPQVAKKALDDYRRKFDPTKLKPTDPNQGLPVSNEEITPVVDEVLF